MRVLDRQGLKSEKGIDWSAPTLRKMIAEKDFPPPIRFANRYYWREKSVDDWLDKTFGGVEEGTTK